MVSDTFCGTPSGVPDLMHFNRGCRADSLNPRLMAGNLPGLLSCPRPQESWDTPNQSRFPFGKPAALNHVHWARMEITYKIIGGDGREYGPASLAELKDWIRDGRVAGRTLVWQSERALWTPATEHPELQTELGPSTPPPLAMESFEPVGFWVRLGAYILDSILLRVTFDLITLHWREKFEVLQRGFDPAITQLSQEKMLELALLSMTY